MVCSALMATLPKRYSGEGSPQQRQATFEVIYQPYESNDGVTQLSLAIGYNSL